MHYFAIECQALRPAHHKKDGSTSGTCLTIEKWIVILLTLSINRLRLVANVKGMVMTQIGEGIAFPSDGSGGKLHKCKWSSCKSQHMMEPKYPNDGKVSKGGAYRSAWIAKDMEPWKIHGDDRQRLMEDGAAEATPYQYETQAHHLVPATLVGKTGTLKDNLKLIGYDCDDSYNGMFLPKLTTDIPIHNLQAHSGNHPGGYMGPLKDSLAQLEKDYDGICNSDLMGSMGPQKTVIAEMAILAAAAKTKIENIKTGANFWPVRTNALAEYNEAQVEYDRRVQLNNA